VLDSPAGRIHVRAEIERRSEILRVRRVAFENVPSFVLLPGIAVSAGGRTTRADVAFGGAFYAIVDAESLGLPLEPGRLADLRRVGMEIKRAVESAHQVVHPLDAGLTGIYGTIFTGPPRADGADLRNVTVFADAEVDRSPCGTGTSAVMAVLAAMELLGEDQPFVHESVIGTTFRGTIRRRLTVGEYQAIVPEIEGSAWITGEHAFVLAEDDPLRAGFRI
jgi:trans-L-3-hydroxyproline dehydratase